MQEIFVRLCFIFLISLLDLSILLCLVSFLMWQYTYLYLLLDGISINFYYLLYFGANKYFGNM